MRMRRPCRDETGKSSSTDSAERTGSLLHAFTVDVEDWFDGIPVGREVKASAERKFERGMVPLLELLSSRFTTATFFLLGPLARDHPRLVKRLADECQELGCNGWSHDLLYSMSSERCQQETTDAKHIIEDIAGAVVTACRAAYFSVTRQSAQGGATAVPSSPGAPLPGRHGFCIPRGMVDRAGRRGRNHRGRNRLPGGLPSCMLVGLGGVNHGDPVRVSVSGLASNGGHKLE